jgi:hypothetical protein
MTTRVSFLNAIIPVSEATRKNLTQLCRPNRGLVDLNLRSFRESDGAWDAVYDSLVTHPTVEVLDLRPRESFKAPPEVLKSRIQALVDMMKVNMSIHTIKLDDHYYSHPLVGEPVVPYIETNRLRPRLLAIKKKPAGVPCQGARTIASCYTNRSQSLLDAFIRECRSCLSVDDRGRLLRLRTSLRLLMMPLLLLQVLLLFLLLLLPLLLPLLLHLLLARSARRVHNPK